MKNLRKNLCFTQKELAALAGVSASALCRYEKGNRTAIDAATHIFTQIQLAKQQERSQQKILFPKKATRDTLQAEKLERKLKSEERKATIAALRNTQALTQMQEKFRGLSSKMDAIQTLKDVFYEDIMRLKLIEIMEDRTEEKLKYCSTMKQLEIRYLLLVNEAKRKVAAEVRESLRKIIVSVKDS